MINLIESGVFVATRKPNIKIQLDDKINRTTVLFDYFDFEKVLINIFDYDRVQKILNLLNEGNQILIDFDKGKVFKITNKEINYNSMFWKTYGNKQAVTKAYNEAVSNININDYEDINARILSTYQSEEITND